MENVCGLGRPTMALLAMGSMQIHSMLDELKIENGHPAAPGYDLLKSSNAPKRSPQCRPRRCRRGLEHWPFERR
jgi:hypothetical protein